MDWRSFGFTQDRLFGLSKEYVKNKIAKNSCLGNWKSTTHTRYSTARSSAELREGKSVLDGALDLGKKRGCQTSQPFDQTPFIDGFDLFSHDLGCKRQTGNPLGYDRVTGREMRRVLGQWDDDHQLAELLDTIIGENDHRPGLFDLDADGRD